MEMVDVVDENLNVLYQTSKEEAHAKGLLHKTVIAEIRNSKGEYLLSKNAVGRQDPGQYVSPVGGHVSAGERDEDALKREVAEEVGMKNFTSKLIGKTIFNRFIKHLNRQENHYFIVYEITTDEEPVTNHEATDPKRFTKNELKIALKNNPKDFGDSYHFIVTNFYPELVS